MTGYLDALARAATLPPRDTADDADEPAPLVRAVPRPRARFEPAWDERGTVAWLEPDEDIQAPTPRTDTEESPDPTGPAPVRAEASRHDHDPVPPAPAADQTHPTEPTDLRDPTNKTATDRRDVTDTTTITVPGRIITELTPVITEQGTAVEGKRSAPTGNDREEIPLMTVRTARVAPFNPEQTNASGGPATPEPAAHPSLIQAASADIAESPPTARPTRESTAITPTAVGIPPMADERPADESWQPIVVEIGRIEVRVAPDLPTPPQRDRPPQPRTGPTLADYLDGRGRPA